MNNITKWQIKKHVSYRSVSYFIKVYRDTSRGKLE